MRFHLRPIRFGLLFTVGVIAAVETWGRLTLPPHLRPTPRRPLRLLRPSGRPTTTTLGA